MANYTREGAGGDLVTCPYDAVHRVKRSRLQIHIAKCKLNHPDLVLKECPFNNTHRIKQHEFTHHLLTCSDRHPLDKQLSVNINKLETYKGHTGVPSYSTYEEIPNGESWENEISPVPTPGYIPSTEPPKGGVITDLGITHPSYRKQVYRSMARAHGENESGNSATAVKEVKTPEVKKEIRMPKEKAGDFIEAQKQNPNILKMQNAQNVGLGRGRPKTDSRIAANIFPAVSPPKPEVNQITNGLRSVNLGIGRGRGNPSSRIRDYDTDFPAL